jgi:uncharacterized membrane protein
MTHLKFALLKLLEYLVIFLIGGTVYVGIEILYRGYSHWSMFIVGGICLIVIGLLNEGLIPSSWGIIKQMLLGAVIITCIEFITGCIVNLGLGLNVWDYSNLPLNIAGQICLPFSIIWFFLSYVAIRVDDEIRYRFFGEAKPKYVLWSTK